MFFGVVALLAEGVDRNWQMAYGSDGTTTSPSSRRAWIEISKTPQNVRSWSVALLAEGVDRNLLVHLRRLRDLGRPPRGGRG